MQALISIFYDLFKIVLLTLAVYLLAAAAIMAVGWVVSSLDFLYYYYLEIT